MYLKVILKIIIFVNMNKVFMGCWVSDSTRKKLKIACAVHNVNQGDVMDLLLIKWLKQPNIENDIKELSALITRFREDAKSLIFSDSFCNLSLSFLAFDSSRDGNLIAVLINFSFVKEYNNGAFNFDKSKSSSLSKRVGILFSNTS